MTRGVRGALASGALACVALAACNDTTGPRPPRPTDDVLALELGEVRVLHDPGEMASVRLPAGAADDYLVVAANANPRPDVVARYTVSVGTPAAAALRGPHARRAAPGAADYDTVAEMWMRSDFEWHLRSAERQVLDVGAGALGWQARRAAGGAAARPSVRGVPVAQGDTVELRVPHADSANLCKSFSTIKAVVRAVGTHAIIADDVATPTGGFADADFAAIAEEFDRLIYPTVTRYFGAPSDFDENDRIVILYTPLVNALTPRTEPGGVARGFIGGFFFGGDLFPRTDQQGRALCTQSNEGEVFYLLAPDPAGAFSDPRTVASVRQGTRGTIAHEFQHMINLGVRLDRNARTFETAWLNEALSHMAEDVVGRRKYDVGDLQNLTFAQLTRDPADFNAFFFQNLARFRHWLERPDTAGATSAKANQSLAVRGAAWALVRWTTDQFSGGDVPTFLRRLVAGPDTGVTNLVAAAAVPFDTVMAGWMVANYTDDLGVPGLAPRYAYVSYDMRGAVSGVSRGQYPLRVFQLGAATPSVTTEAPSASGNYFRITDPSPTAAVELRFRSPAGAPASFAGARLYVVRVN